MGTSDAESSRSVEALARELTSILGLLVEAARSLEQERDDLQTLLRQAQVVLRQIYADLRRATDKVTYYEHLRKNSQG